MPLALPITSANLSIIAVVMQTDGHAYRISNEVIQHMLSSVPLRALLARYAQVLAVQMAYTALAAAAFPIGVRLARWILMARDRVGARR